MKWSLLCGALMLVLLFIVWYRKPAGRSTSDPGTPTIKGLKEFDIAHPGASETLRTTFYNAVQAHLERDFSTALTGYNSVLDIVPNEPATLHNKNLLPNVLPNLGLPKK